MRVLCVGGAGYVGSVLVPRLRDKHRVTVYDPLNDLKQDVRDAKLLLAFCEGKDAVIYLAGITNNDECVRNPTLAESVNHFAFMDAVDSAVTCRIKRFIFASSVAAYGSSDEEMNETNELKPTTPYGLAKKQCELYLRDAPLCWVVIRSASVCGYSENMRSDLTINKMVHDALTKGMITVNGGEQFRCHVAIEDLCEFYKLVVEAPEHLVRGQAFNVVALNESVRQTAETVMFVVGTTGIYHGPATDSRSYKVSGKKAEEVLGWKPKRTIHETVLDMVEKTRVHA